MPSAASGTPPSGSPSGLEPGASREATLAWAARAPLGVRWLPSASAEPLACSALGLDLRSADLRQPAVARALDLALGRGINLLALPDPIAPAQLVALQRTWRAVGTTRQACVLVGFAPTPGLAPRLDLRLTASAPAGGVVAPDDPRHGVALPLAEAGSAADLDELARRCASCLEAGLASVIVTDAGSVPTQPVSAAASRGLGPEVDAALAVLRRLEGRWSVGLGARLRAADGAHDLRELLRWGRAIPATLGDPPQLDAWSTLRHDVIAPQLADVARGLLQHLPPEPRAEFAAFWAEYGAAMAAVFDALERRCAREHSASGADRRTPWLARLRAWAPRGLRVPAEELDDATLRWCTLLAAPATAVLVPLRDTPTIVQALHAASVLEPGGAPEGSESPAGSW